jgi:hypothetical protein
VKNYAKNNRQVHFIIIIIIIIQFLPHRKQLYPRYEDLSLYVVKANSLFALRIKQSKTKHVSKTQSVLNVIADGKYGYHWTLNI